MNIKILSDSTCDLSQGMLEKYDIGIVPLIVMKDEKEYLDGITITAQDIFDHVAAGGALCTTAARNMAIYQDAFEEYANRYDGVVHISLGSAFSSSYQNACLAADEFENVRIIDSQALSTAQALVVLKAAELGKTAASLDELVEALNAFTSKLESSFVVDKLDYLAKGGRCSAATALGANLLSLKPCIELKQNHMSVGKKYRGNLQKCLTTYVKDRFADREDIDWSRLMLVYTAGMPEEILTAVREAIGEYGKFETILESTAGCTISCHCGPGAFGLMFMKK